ncbi:hypothetical protein LuPra_00813 [Luteitalea pratensis]|uniref:Uncharacterized protein n=1 Tax=Luteitalea pratensis TaxID=1855912 RepID=A0A143PIN2_LUTPR|nr:hypothetical protein [Luteitalea pratensis]AMY07639.1 hypothetical protein LuPra_00813 [Luteitalea pratensis]
MCPHPHFGRPFCCSILLFFLVRAVPALGQASASLALASPAAGTVASDVSRASPGSTAAGSRVYIADTRVRRAAESALQIASTQAATRRCQRVLSEFVDGGQPPLTARLNALKLPLQEYVRTVVFVDGGSLPACRKSVLAVTMPGSRVVHLCGAAFADVAGHSPVEAGVLVMHEVLHTLGLGESPPSPAYISRRVRELCW